MLAGFGDEDAVGLNAPYIYIRYKLLDQGLESHNCFAGNNPVLQLTCPVQYRQLKN